MSDQPSDPNKRNILTELAGLFGRTIREARAGITDATEERLDEIQGDMEKVADQVATLRELSEQERHLWMDMARQLQRIEQQLTQVEPQTRAQGQRVTQLRGRARELGVALVSAVGGALLAATVQEELYPHLRRAVSRWVEWAQEPAPPQPMPASPPPSPVPEADAPSIEPEEMETPVPESVSLGPLEPELMRVPAGNFIMGSDKRRDPLASADEMPQHRLYLPQFYMGKYPVTNAEYARFVQETGHRTPGHWENGHIPSEKAQHPVVEVDWHDVRVYCAWLSKVTGRTYRLPTEAEWEKAARGTDGRIYPWGNQPPTDRLCNCRGNVGTVGNTTMVGSYPDGASPCGCLDMAGNVWEWTSSLYRNYPYDAGDGRENPNEDERRVLRGGSFVIDVQSVRCAFRGYYSPVSRFRFWGFRVVSPGL